MYNHYNKLLSLIFFTGAVVLSLELLASRILTPFFGVSLYIWTSILAVTLIFLALGYQLGGWITSKFNKEYYIDLFIFIPFLSSVFILLSVLLYPYILPKLIGVNLLLGSFIGSFLLLSIPLVLLSALNPILISIIKSSYLSTRNLADATRILINEFFGHYGLLILDPNEKKLKEIFSPIIKSELSFQECHDSVNQTLKLFKKKSPKYKPQVKPREINLFFIENNSRKRIYKKSPEIFSIDKSNITFTKKEILEVLKLHPEKFSPNVLMRPIYQETILPNICYIGGGAELSYWLELSDYFKNKKVPFPIILHRNSALLINSKTSVKLTKLNIAFEELFIGRLALINKKIRQISDIDLDLSFQKRNLKKQFKFLEELANKTDKTFINAVNAEMSKQIKGIDKLEKRLLKAQRIKLKDQVERLVLIHESLFPHEELQERILNFSELYEIYGQKIIDFLLKKFDPLSQKFDLLELPEKI